MNNNPNPNPNPNLDPNNKEEYFSDGIMLYNEEDPAWRQELMIAQIMIYLEKGITQSSLNILYGKKHVDTALFILKPSQKHIL
ncbi:MAG: hypothetical protein H7263_08960 [Candidatus Sericytochromatia bacterium]|nr:hypothetical protein [Candidatus Sericytochromatia bacterium]